MTGAGGVVLALDFGLRRIGVATANLLTRTATPLTTLRTPDGVPWNELDALVRDWQPSAVVVGIPRRDDARAIETAIREFMAALESRYGVAVEGVDESYTSQAARSALRERRRSGHLRRRIGRHRIDRQAACLIAEQWLSER